LYVYEMRNPGRLTILRLLLSYSPWLALIIGFVTWHAFTGFKTMIPLTSFDVIAEHIRQPEVLLRIALAVVYLPYGLIVLIQKNTWREASVPQPWVNIISVITFIFTCTFILGMLCRITVLMYLHTLLCDALLAIVLYMEAHIRIPLPVSAPQSEKVVITRLAAKMQELMDTGIWKNPDITRDDYCRLLGTNRLYMAKAVQSLGYSNIADMLNYYRLERLHQLLQKYPNAKVQDLVFEAGYRNRETANRLFAQKYGNTLTAYRLGGGKNSTVEV